MASTGAGAIAGGGIITVSGEVIAIGSIATLGGTYLVTSATTASESNILQAKKYKNNDVNNLDLGKQQGGLNEKLGKANEGVSNPESKQLVNGPYIKNGKPNGRPTSSGKKKLQFERDVYNDNVDLDGILRDPNTGEAIDWKPGQPRRGVVDFGHKSGYSYKEMFNKYKNGEITLDELKDFQINPDNYRLETPSANRSHKFE